MIARYTEKGWEIITQRAHGLIAAQLAFHWRKSQRPKRWVETLLAIAEHDDAENELDGEELLTDAGGPVNFDMNKFELAHCEKLHSLTITKSRYIALLTSMHMEFLYGGGKEKSQEAVRFLKDQKSLRKKWLRELKMSKSEADKVYDLVEWCDALSLLICTDVIQPLKRAVEISTGPDKRKYDLHRLDDKKLTIKPWPFEVTSFTINYEYRSVSTIEFKSSEELRASIINAKVKEKEWTIVKSGGIASKADIQRNAGKSKLTMSKS